MNIMTIEAIRNEEARKAAHGTKFEDYELTDFQSCIDLTYELRKQKDITEEEVAGRYQEYFQDLILDMSYQAYEEHCDLELVDKVVPCRSCSHYDPTIGACFCQNYSGVFMDPDDFCSKGERMSFKEFIQRYNEND